MNLFELYATLSLDTRKFDSGVDSAVKSGQSLSAQLDKASASGSMLRDVFGGNLLADGLKQLGSMMLETAKESIALASDLEEVQNVVDVTFGDNAGEINAWARGAKSAFGMSELNAKRFSGTIGAMMRSMGLAGDEVKGMSMNLVALAGDMASFYNLDHETAFDKIRSGISGETEPLKQLGINMSVANLEAFALAEGITKTYDAMTEAERATLRYNYLLSVTSGAQGDFARTSKNYANAMRVFEENINSIKTSMGTSLLEYITPAITTFNEWYASLTETNATHEQQQAQEDYEAQVEDNQNTYERGLALIQVLEQMEDQTELTEAEAYIWNNTLEELVRIFPELQGVIDLTTGEIQGGTEALRKYNEEWLNTANLDAQEALLKRQRQAVVDSQTNLFELQAQQRQAEQYAAIQFDQLAQQAVGMVDYVNDYFARNPLMGKSPIVWDPNDVAASTRAVVGAINAIWDNEYYWNQASQIIAGSSSMASETAVQKEIAAFLEYADAASAATSEVNALADEVTKAEQIHEDANKTYRSTAEFLGYTVESYEAMSDAEAEAAKAREQFVASLEEESQVLADLEVQIADIATYRLESIDRARKSVEAGLGSLTNMPDWQLEGDALQEYEDNLFKALEAQRQFLNAYERNLSVLRKKGVDEGLLAMLSNGSVESAQTVAALMRMTDEELAAYVKGWKQLEADKSSLATVMAENTLAVDTGFQNMVDAAEEAAASFDFSEAAATALSNVAEPVDEWTAAMAEDIARITTGAAAARSELEQLGGVNFGSNAPDGQHSAGLGYVPYDGYMAELHRGEQVLTAAEASSRRQAQDYAPAIDYDRIAEAASHRPVVVYVDKKAAAVLMTREMDTAIGNRNIQQLVSMGG